MVSVDNVWLKRAIFEQSEASYFYQLQNMDSFEQQTKSCKHVSRKERKKATRRKSTQDSLSAIKYTASETVDSKEALLNTCSVESSCEIVDSLLVESAELRNWQNLCNAESNYYKYLSFKAKSKVESSGKTEKSASSLLSESRVIIPCACTSEEKDLSRMQQWQHLSVAESSYYAYVTTTINSEQADSVIKTKVDAANGKTSSKWKSDVEISDDPKLDEAVPTEMFSSIEESIEHGVWLSRSYFNRWESVYHSYWAVNRRKRKPKKKAKPFTITRRPPVDADFIPEETNHEGEKVVTEVNNGRIWTELLLAVQENESQTPAEMLMKEDYVKLLNHLIHKSDNDKLKGSKLTIFGSTYNGFGNTGSDLDIVLLFPNPRDDNLNLTNMDVINALSKVLRTSPFFEVIRVLQVIRGARVPIVKFMSTHKKYPGLSGDICARNRLGPRNTKLMAAYANYDERLRTLGYGIKKFAKLADINDASAGSLSSYAYLLMMIYYLQRIQPPILPCLQNVQLSKANEQVLRIEDDMNTWYQSDLDFVRGVTAAAMPRNSSSVGDLWKGFFEFWCKFDFRSQIDIRMRSSPTVRRVAIEIRDPFDEEHDLGRVLRLQGENLIRNCFFSAQNLFKRIQLKQMKLSTRNKLELFKWLVEQVSNSHPFENMRTCWLCGEGDHFKSVCHIFAERKRNEGVAERAKARQRYRQRRTGKDDVANENSQPAQKSQNSNVPGVMVPNANKQIRQPVRRSNDLNPRNGMTLSDAIINYNSQPSVAKKAPILVHQHQNGFISPLTSLDHFRIQSNPQYQQNQMMTPQQFYPSQPRYQNLPDPNRGQMNYFVPPAQQQQYIGPRFMRDPSNTPGNSYSGNHISSGRPFFQDVMPATMHQQSPVFVDNQRVQSQPVPNGTNSYSKRNNGQKLYGRNQNRTFPESNQQMQMNNNIGGMNFGNESVNHNTMGSANHRMKNAGAMGGNAMSLNQHHQQMPPVRQIYQRANSSGTPNSYYTSSHPPGFSPPYRAHKK